MLYAAVMRLEGGDVDIAARLDAGLTHGSGLFMCDDILKEAGKADKLRRRMQHKGLNAWRCLPAPIFPYRCANVGMRLSP